MTRQAALLTLLAFAGGALLGQRLGALDGELDRAPPPPGRAMVEAPEPAMPLAQLMALGYIDGAVDARTDEDGVLLHDAARAAPGLNLYYTRAGSRAALLTNAGEEVHAWEHAEGPWQHAHVLPDGGLLALVKDRVLLRLDPDSALLWRHDAWVHHDLDVGPEGEVYVLERRAEPRPALHGALEVLVEDVVRLSPDGEETGRVHLLDSLLASELAFLLPETRSLDPDDLARRSVLDALHPNHVERLGPFDAPHPADFQDGDLLLSFRNLHLIAVLRPNWEAPGDSEWVWAWGPSNLSYPHHPSLLDSGNLLLFDNGTERSRVVELDPVGKEILWTASPAEDFFSRNRGSAQRLPNGNTLITESDRGHVWEVTPEGEPVWRFANPARTEDGRREAIWRMLRYDPDALPFLSESGD